MKRTSKKKFIEEELNIFNINEKTDNCKKKYVDHVQRMGFTRISKFIMEYKPTGKQEIRSPKKRWEDQLWVQQALGWLSTVDFLS
jgi:hypothetical protein